MTDNATQIAMVLESIRTMLRTLPSDEARAQVVQALTGPASEADVRTRIESALASAGTVVGAAKLLGVGKRTLMERMRQLGGFPPRQVGRKRKLV